MQVTMFLVHGEVGVIGLGPTPSPHLAAHSLASQYLARYIVNA